MTDVNFLNTGTRLQGRAYLTWPSEEEEQCLFWIQIVCALRHRHCKLRVCLESLLSTCIFMFVFVNCNYAINILCNQVVI